MLGFVFSPVAFPLLLTSLLNSRNLLNQCVIVEFVSFWPRCVSIFSFALAGKMLRKAS